MPEQPIVPSAPYPPMHSIPPARSSLASSPQYRTDIQGINSSNANPNGINSNNNTNTNNNTNNNMTSTAGNSQNNLMTPTMTPTPLTNVREGLSESDNEAFNALRHQLTEMGQKTVRPSHTAASRIKFYATSCGTLACINTASAISHSPTEVIDSEESQRNRKLGPVLLELRQLQLVDNNQDNENNNHDNELFTTKTIALSRGNPQLGISVSSTCLDMPVVQNYSGHTSKSRFIAATGLTTGMLAIHTFSEMPGLDDLPYSSAIEYYHVSRHHRQSSAVAWNTHHANHVAIGLLGSGATGPQPGGTLPRRGGPTIRGGGGGDREFCCFLWDIEAQQQQQQQLQSVAKKHGAPISKLSHNAPVASLAWVMDGQTLAVGTQSRNVQLYDMRVSGTNAPPLSALAHNFGVHGIEVDPHKPYIMATYCRAIGEPVKLWDVRRMDSVVNEIKISPGTIARTSQSLSSAQYTNQMKVETVRWSTAEPGVLCVAIGESVQEFDTSSTSRPVLIRVNHHSKPGSTIQDIALYSGSKPKPLPTESNKTETTPSTRLLNALYSRRMVVMLDDRTLVDMAKHNGVAPLAISRRDGRLVHALGPTVWVGPTNNGPSAMERPNLPVGEDDDEEDISATMLRRGRCIQQPRYSMNTAQNIKMLAEDIPSGAGVTKEALLSKLALFRLWLWIERVETLSTEGDELDKENPWSARTLVDTGIMQLLARDGTSPPDDVYFSPTLSCNLYSSPSRDLALTSCGWEGKFGLDIVLAECETLGEYERSAALAVWHGDIGAAVEALQRASVSVRDHLDGNKNSSLSFVTPQYAETLDLIAMCVAGYNGASTTSTQQASVWRSACSKLLQRSDLSDPYAKNNRTVYLRALCHFLLHVGIDTGFDYILGNEYLAYGDRIAFACRFLDQDQLQAYLVTCLEKCQQVGNVEGLVISGISKEGIKILQAFVDRTSDVQTAALVVSRVLLPQDWTEERKICMEWVESYRGLLNIWQMWQSRAMFDVDRAETLRRLRAKLNDPARRLQNRRQGSRVADVDTLVSIPAALDARCNYCSSSLGLKRHEGSTNQWLSKMKPVLSCCPQCRKPLPRCAICLLSLGALNPYMQLVTKERSRPASRGTNPAIGQDDLGSLPLAEWFTWCMNCKHGGHAHHLVGWFANHETCPVSGCECHCQFDGIQKLNRPALLKKDEGLEADVGGW